MKHPTQVVFAGGGGKYHYSLGVLAIIQRNGFKTEHFSGTSSGVFPALFGCLGFDAEEIFHSSFSMPVLEQTKKHCCGAFLTRHNIIRARLQEILPSDAYLRVKGKLHISLTQLTGWSFEQVIISEWDDNSDLISCMLAAGFIPGTFELGLTSSYKGKRYLDGGIVDNFPVGIKAAPAFIIHGAMWRPQPWANTWPWANRTHAESLFEMGKHDAIKHIAEIEAAFNQH